MYPGRVGPGKARLGKSHFSRRRSRGRKKQKPCCNRTVFRVAIRHLQSRYFQSHQNKHLRFYLRAFALGLFFFDEISGLASYANNEAVEKRQKNILKSKWVCNETHHDTAEADFLWYVIEIFSFEFFYSLNAASRGHKTKTKRWFCGPAACLYQAFFCSNSKPYELSIAQSHFP